MFRRLFLLALLVYVLVTSTAALFHPKHPNGYKDLFRANKCPFYKGSTDWRELKICFTNATTTKGLGTAEEKVRLCHR